jgi:hypothetical protein
MTAITNLIASRPFSRIAAAATVFAVVSFATPSLAEGTAEQRAACTPDAFRLCSSEIPNAERVKACMIRQRSKLSPRCAAVFHPERAKPAAAKTATNS